MLVLQKVFLLSLLALLGPQNTTAPKQELNDQLFEAVRKGDAAAVTSLLDRGADVNGKFRYGMTALFKAAERGNVEVVKVLLDRGADVKVKDTFYQATAMTWALNGKHYDIVRLLLQKGSDGVEDVLTQGTQESNPELVKMALDSGALKPEHLTVALAAAEGNEKNAAIVEMLKKAGAQPPLAIDAATLQSYSGKYKAETGPELTISTKDGKLFASGFGRQELPLMPLDKTTFRPLAFSGFTFTFNVEGDKVTALTFKQGPNTNQMKRVEEVKP
jgi:ankyrin repeat protein